jgi:hypothetical protein
VSRARRVAGPWRPEPSPATLSHGESMSERKPARRNDPKPARPATAKGGRPFTLTTGGAALVLGLLTVLFFHALVFEGKTFVSPDTTAPAGFVRVGEQSLYQEHVYPLWNPYVFLGMPSFASGAYNPLIYPPDWPLALVNKVVPLPDMTWMLLYYFLGGLFMFLLAREVGARPEGALLAAAVFVFTPNLVAVGSHGHGSQLVDSAYLPLMLWLVARWLRRGGLHHLAWLALAGGFQLLRAHVQICFYTWAAVGLYLAVEWVVALLRRRAELGPLTLRVLGVVGAAVVAFGLAGFYNLPLQDYARHSIRGGGAGGGVGMGYATGWSMAPYELPSLVVPGWTGFGGASYWGGMPFTDYPNAFVGLVAMLFAVFAFLTGGRKRVFALLLAALALLISFGRYFPLYGFLYDHLPLFNKFRVPVMVVILFQLAVALGVAWGWSAILPGAAHSEEERVRSRRTGRLLAVLTAVVALVLVVSVLGRGAWRTAYVQGAMAHKGGTGITMGTMASGSDYGPDQAAAAWEVFYSGIRPASGLSADLGVPGLGWVPGLLGACVLGLLALGAAWAARRRWLGALPATALALAILLLELWPVSAHVMGPVVGGVAARDLDSGRDDVVQFFEQAGPRGSFRIFTYSPDEPVPNRYAGFAIGNVSGYHAAKPRLFQDLAEGHLMRYVDLEWLRLLNVRYLVECEAHVQQVPPPPELRLVFRGSQAANPNFGPLMVFEFPAALPRVMLLEHYSVVPDAKAIIDSVSLRQRDVAHGTWLEEDPQVKLGPVAGGRADIVAYGLNRVAIDVVTPGPALLRLADLWYPDWHAYVDGKRAPVLRADYLLRAVVVPAGRHRVEFRYESAAVRNGLLLSLASLLVVLAGFAVSWWLGRRPRPAATAGEGA